jgi:hypothetical protein
MTTHYIFIYKGTALGPDPDFDKDFNQAASFDGRTVTFIGDDENGRIQSYFGSPKWVYEVYKQNDAFGQSGNARALQHRLSGSYTNSVSMQDAEGAKRFEQARKILGGKVQRFTFDDINMDGELDIPKIHGDDPDDVRKFHRQRVKG